MNSLVHSIDVTPHVYRKAWKDQSDSVELIPLETAIIKIQYDFPEATADYIERRFKEGGWFDGRFSRYSAEIDVFTGEQWPIYQEAQ